MGSSPEDWKAYVNGRIVPVAQARVPIFDRGFEYGDGVFEGILCYDGRLFKVDEHLARLYRSAQAVCINISLTKSDFKEIIKRTVRANGFRYAHIKPFVTRGTHYELKDPTRPIEPNIVVLVRPLEGDAMSIYGDPSKGFKLASVSVRKIPQVCLDPRIKCQNFLTNILAWYEAVASGADEALVLDIQGNVAECSFANIFVARGDELHTPTSTHCLEGITRETIIELAREAGYPVQERVLTPYDVRTANEVFATGTAAGVAPMVEFDGQPIGDGKVGAITSLLMSMYERALLKGEPVYE
jgi:branched-chain amino acid aminotransferase